MVIKCIMFDWGGVCARGNLAHVLGRRLSKKMKRSAPSITAAYLKYCWDYQVGKTTAKNFWKKVQDELDTNIAHPFLVNHHVKARVLNKGVIDIIKRLRKNYKVVLVTNTYKEYFEHNNKKHKIDTLFDDIILSYKVKGRKPEPKIYKHALKVSKCRPSEVIFIEDKDKHLKPARKLGMKTILYKNQADLKSRLKKLRVNF